MSKSYRLRISTLGIQNANDGKAVSVVVPAGAILKKISEAGDLTTCVWTGGEIQMFSFDLEERAEWIGGAGK